MNNKTTTYAVARAWAESKGASSKGTINTTVSVAADEDAFIDLETERSPVLSIVIHAADDSGSHAVCADFGNGKVMMDVATHNASELRYALDRVTAPWFTGPDTPLAA